MITKNDAMTHYIFYHVRLRNSDGSALRCRANGRCKEWKREPERFSLPVKYGLKQCFYLEPSNAHEWLTYDPTEEDREAERVAKRKAQLRKRFNLADDTPDGILHDRMIDAGMDAELASIVTRS